jgi:hydroxymethylpyrimidine/phosphomethylpyrimidine kinase
MTILERVGLTTITERSIARRWDNIVCDPVLVSTSGTPLLDRDGLEALISALPLFTLLTPNVPEVIAITRKSVASESHLIEAGHALLDLGARAVLLKGGHLSGDKSTDILLQNGISEPTYFSSRRIHTRNDHGTGCALATAIASGLATGIDLPDAVSEGREFVQEALRRSIDLWNGSGRGSMDLLSACAAMAAVFPTAAASDTTWRIFRRLTGKFAGTLISNRSEWPSG